MNQKQINRNCHYPFLHFIYDDVDDNNDVFYDLYSLSLCCLIFLEYNSKNQIQCLFRMTIV
ncbi:hypothetical protein DERP_001295 [Dermatophagoides pteronyssinus]|uniref:Uncharacterized protein n=1 Tax=Dermatophagoides pteronyssinus TaxID=6956 RepID=A0ABQ8JE19_DERPT|nr:hypothetical protein DERP_001295 [Dermatophagoides pteronyssinus]